MFIEPEHEKTKCFLASYKCFSDLLVKSHHAQLATVLHSSFIQHQKLVKADGITIILSTKNAEN